MAPEKKFVLPRRIYVLNKDKKYLSRTWTGGLIFEKTSPDEDCVFDVQSYRDEPTTFELRSKNEYGSTVNIQRWKHETPHLRCQGTTLVNPIYRPGMPMPTIDPAGGPDPDYEQLGTELKLVHITDNKIYIRTKPHDNTPSYFVTSDLFGTHKDSLNLTTNASDTALFEIVEPVLKREIYDIKYDIPDASITKNPPLVALNTTVRNDSTSSDARQTLSYSYTKSEVGTWNNTVGVEIGVSTTFETGIPYIAKGEIQVSTSFKYSHDFGGSKGTDKTVTSSTEITVPPGKKGKAVVLIKQAEINVGFSYKEKVEYSSGETRVEEKRGVYNNVDSWGVDVQVGNWEDV